MLVEVELAGGQIAAGLFAHQQCSESVGNSVAAFARCPASRQQSEPLPRSVPWVQAPGPEHVPQV